MIKFFRINDPFRLLTIILFLIVLRFTYSFIHQGIFESELLWMLLGEKMASGSIIYSEIDDLTSVLSAMVYWLIDLGFDRSKVIHQIVAFIFVFIQMYFYNGLINKTTLLNERNYVLGFVFILLACSAPDFFLLSPDLMATTFLLIAVHFLFQDMKDSHAEDNILAMGWCFGIALAFNIHFIYFGIMIVLSLLLYSTLTARKLFVLILGVCLPYGLISIFYVIFGGFSYFIYESVFYALVSDTTNYINFLELIIVFGFTLFVGIIAVLKIYGASGFVNYKVRCQTVFVFWIACSILCGVLNEKHSWYSYYSIIVPLSYFISGYLMSLKKVFFKFIIINGFIICCIVGGYNQYIYDSKSQMIDYKKSMIKPTDTKHYGKILVIDNDYSMYINNELGSRFLNHKLANTYFDNMNYYDMVIKVNTAFEIQKPDLIVDPKHKIEQVFERIPQLKPQYHQQNNYYFLNSIH